MLQESVDVLISNGKRGRSVTGSNGRPLKSLGNIIEGKQGRFRQNLLGKRVDYSARSVIVVGPQLDFHQCGLPKEMALELFKPFVIRKLVEKNIVTNVKSAKKKIERKDVEVWDILESVIKGQLVLLNRAPTLHRLGIQAFAPILVEGSAIQIHPLVCTAFNADFDGDQMAVHVPLSVEAQSECRLLILSKNNILAPSSGKSIVTPTQDMVLGCYYLTVIDEDSTLGKNKNFADKNEARRAWESNYIGLQTKITVRMNNERFTTSMGRIILNNHIDEIFHSYSIDNNEFINEVVGKKKLADLVFNWYTTHGNEITSDLINRLKVVGFRYSTLAGISISVDDMIIPSGKEDIISKAESQVNSLNKTFDKGDISSKEKVMKTNEIWRSATQMISNNLESEMGALNNVSIMANSGARGNIDQVRQLSGMRGLMSDAQGRTLSIPIISSFKEGLSLTEYFLSTYGARKGLVDTALRTADSGYLTRRLVDVSQDVILREKDCKTSKGIHVKAIYEGRKITVPLSELIEGRQAQENITLPGKKSVFVKKGHLITASEAKQIEESGLETVFVRSIYTCETTRGICQACYGLDLATQQPINIGEAVGIVAAQSIGEPGTQLTMRTFHTGGVDLRQASRETIKVNTNCKLNFTDLNVISETFDDDGNKISVIKEAIDLECISDKNKSTVQLPAGSTLVVDHTKEIKANTIIAEFDPTYEYIKSSVEGIVFYNESNLRTQTDKNKFLFSVNDNNLELIVYNPSKTKSVKVTKTIGAQITKNTNANISDLGIDPTELGNHTFVIDIKKVKDDFELVLAEASLSVLVPSSRIYVSNGSKVKIGDIIAKELVEDPEASKTKDIVQGLPKVEELFEARRPKNSALLSEIEGVVNIVKLNQYYLLTVLSDSNEKKDYKVLFNTRILVNSGETVTKGQQLTDGVVSSQDVLATQGVEAVQYFLSNEIMKVYRSQGVFISGKHIDVIVRQLTKKVLITDMGNTNFIPNELIDSDQFKTVNEQMKKDGKSPATGDPVLLGITRSSLTTDSFISASSFQQTASVLTRASVEGMVDPMRGLKENVIIGKTIPAGTGLYKWVSLKSDIENDKTGIESISEAEEVDLNV